MSTFATAWKAFWAILRSPEKADAWTRAQQPDAAPAALPQHETASPSAPPSQDEAVHALAVLQRESRLVDFLMEDVAPCDDEQLGAAVRKIHDDAHDALVKYFGIAPIRQDAQEGDAVTVPANFDSRRIRLAGKPVGEPPFKGTLVHKGWYATHVNLPVSTAAVDPTVVVPAEIEI